MVSYRKIEVQVLIPKIHKYTITRIAINLELNYWEYMIINNYIKYDFI